ncbi:MAG: hypothetical protein Q4G36_00400 [Paracoccus sp. (in: a-proteobacteria)]|nr:hypothetical protein [Paracoccus sp. (in: a-proteobacteria)]
MSDGDDKPKSIDISQLVNSGNNDQSEALVSIAGRAAELSVCGRALQEASRGIGAGALAEAARSATMMKDQLDALTGVGAFTERMKAEQEAMRALPDMSAFSGMSALADQFKIEQARSLALAGLSEGFMHAITEPAIGAASKLFQDMREQSSLINQHIGIFEDMRRALEVSSLFNLTKAMDIPRFGSGLEELGIGRIGAAIEAADAAHMLGLTSTFHDDFRLATAALADRASAFNQLRDVSSIAAPNVDLAMGLGTLLARGLAAQEALLEEHKASAADAKAKATFKRRIDTIGVIIGILDFFLLIAFQLEARLSDPDAAIRANTEAVVEMRKSFDARAAPLEAQQSETKYQDAADAEIVSILREIAKTLSDQPEAEPDAELQAADTPSPKRHRVRDPVKPHPVR